MPPSLVDRGLWMVYLGRTSRNPSRAPQAVPRVGRRRKRSGPDGDVTQMPAEFGNYLLLKKLGEDPLGETFRAGKVGRAGLEQVVLLRVWNGRGLEGDRFGQALAARAAVQQALRSPNIGSGVDLRRVRNFSY